MRLIPVLLTVTALLTSLGCAEQRVRSPDGTTPGPAAEITTAQAAARKTALHFGTQTAGANTLNNSLSAASYAGLTFNSASAFTIGGNNVRSNFCLPGLAFPRTLVLSTACPLACHCLPT